MQQKLFVICLRQIYSYCPNNLEIQNIYKLQKYKLVYILCEWNKKFFDINTMAKLGLRIRVDKSTFYFFISVKIFFYVITKNNNTDNKLYVLYYTIYSIQYILFTFLLIRS